MGAPGRAGRKWGGQKMGRAENGVRHDYLPDIVPDSLWLDARVEFVILV